MLTRVRFVLVLLISSALGVAVTAPSAQARVVDCRVSVSANSIITSARSMTCRQAAADMRRYRGSIAYRFSTPGGFACKRVSGGRLGGQWRCTRGARAYRFEFGD